MPKVSIVVSPAGKLLIQDFKSAFTGLLLMLAGTLVTTIIDFVLGYVTKIDLSSVTVNGYPIMVIVVPFVTYLLNLARKSIQSNSYLK